MKKIIIILLFLICFPVFVNADGTDKYYIEANILENGNMEVKELKILSGSYNGIETKLRYLNFDLQKFSGVLSDFEGSSIYNATKLSNLQVYGVPYTNPTFALVNSPEKIKFTADFYAQPGDYGKYTFSNDVCRVYLPSSYKMASLITYTLEDVVVVHNDVAEIAWDFIGFDYREKIGELIIVVNLPKESSTLRVFSHGPLTGSNSIETKSQVKAVYNDVDPGKAIDVRVVFDKEIVPLATKKSSIDGFDFILQVEEARANKANMQRNIAKNRMLIITAVFVIDLIFVFSTAIYYFIKHDKERKSAFYGKYYREFIEDYNVEVIDYLFNKSISANAMSASIMNLIYKKNISVTKETYDNKKKAIYVFTKLADSENSSEKMLMDFLFVKVGNGQKFTDMDLQNYAKSTKTYSDFTGSYTAWKNHVVAEGEALKFWEKSSLKIILLILGIILFALFYLLQKWLNIGQTFHLPTLLVINFIYFIYIFRANKRTEFGNEHYVRWSAFRNFLNDFGSFKEKDLPEIILWERYLVYATIFGLAKKVQKEMNVKIKEMQLDNSTAFGNYTIFDYMLINNLVNSSVSSAIRTAQITASKVASSEMSSGGGFGGGSSFGGGGFGGGGSGGGRF